MKFKNATKETLRFECGDEVKQVGTIEVLDAGIPRRMPRRIRVPKQWVVAPGEVIDIEEGYAVKRYGAGPKDRGSFLDEIGLTDKLVCVEPRAS